MVGWGTERGTDNWTKVKKRDGERGSGEDGCCEMGMPPQHQYGLRKRWRKTENGRLSPCPLVTPSPVERRAARIDTGGKGGPARRHLGEELGPLAHRLPACARARARFCVARALLVRARARARACVYTRVSPLFRSLIERACARAAAADGQGPVEAQSPGRAVLRSRALFGGRRTKPSLPTPTPLPPLKKTLGAPNSGGAPADTPRHPNSGQLCLRVGPDYRQTPRFPGWRMAGVWVGV